MQLGKVLATPMGSPRAKTAHQRGPVLGRSDLAPQNSCCDVTGNEQAVLSMNLDLKVVVVPKVAISGGWFSLNERSESTLPQPQKIKGSLFLMMIRSNSISALNFISSFLPWTLYAFLLEYVHSFLLIQIWAWIQLTHVNFENYTQKWLFCMPRPSKITVTPSFFKRPPLKCYTFSKYLYLAYKPKLAFFRLHTKFWDTSPLNQSERKCANNYDIQSIHLQIFSCKVCNNHRILNILVSSEKC